MLTNLHVKNLALIDEAEVEFGPGLNILTGETGAGKSILIGSINAALGKKISREMIRTGETSALVELVFETENPHVLELLKEMDLEAEEGQVIISRKITGSRSVCRINGEACNISQVKALASLLLDIHGQHEHQSLLYPDRQIAILDAFAGTEAATAKGEVRALYQEWKNVRKELSAYELDEEARKREAAFLTFEINEIDQAELKEGEDEALETAYRKMGHAKKIAESLQTVYAITGYGAENSAGEQVGRAIRELQQAAVYDDALSGPSQTLSDIDGLLNDFNREISAYLSELTFSEEEYYETEKRLDEINRLKAKYGKTMEEITAYREEQQKKLEKLEKMERMMNMDGKLVYTGTGTAGRSATSLTVPGTANYIVVRMAEPMANNGTNPVAVAAEYGSTRIARGGTAVAVVGGTSGAAQVKISFAASGTVSIGAVKTDAGTAASEYPFNIEGFQYV